MSKPWTKDEDVYFTKLWDAGHSPEIISNMMAKRGRPIVALTVKDRAHRLQLTPRRTPPTNRVGCWTATEKAKVTKLWGEGQSASEIACVISRMRDARVSRNSVIGVVHRMGLKKRVQPKAPKFTKPKSRRAFGQEKRNNSTGNHMVTPKPKKTKKPLPKAVKADRDRIGPTTEQLKDFMCRWPVGVKANGEQMFCGEKTEHRAGTEGKQAYCCEHLARSKSQMSDEQREQISGRMKEMHRAGGAHNIHKRKRAA